MAGDSPRRSIAVLLLLTAVSNGILWVFTSLTQTVTATYVFALMWMSGVAAMLTCRIVGRPLSNVGLGRPALASRTSRDRSAGWCRFGRFRVASHISSRWPTEADL